MLGRRTVRTVVTGPPHAWGGWLEREYPRDTTVGAVRDAAMKRFRLSDDDEITYVVVHERLRQPSEATLDTLIGTLNWVELAIVKTPTNPQGPPWR